LKLENSKRRKLVGESLEIKKVLKRIELVAPSNM